MKISIAIPFFMLCFFLGTTCLQAAEPISTSGKSIDEIADMLKKQLEKQQMDEKLKKASEDAKKEKKEPVIYKYVDERGQWHFSGDIQGVPEKYRRSAIEIPVDKKQPQRNQPRKTEYKHDSSQFVKDLEKRETEGLKWRAGWLELQNTYDEKLKVYEAIKDIPPDCTLAHLGYAPMPADPENGDCVQNWQLFVEKCKIEMQEARRHLEEYREQARRAGVPPGYLR